MNYGPELRLIDLSLIDRVAIQPLIDLPKDVILLASSLLYKPIRSDRTAEHLIVRLFQASLQLSLEYFVILIDNFQFLSLNQGSVLLLDVLVRLLVCLPAALAFFPEPSLAAPEA